MWSFCWVSVFHLFCPPLLWPPPRSNFVPFGQLKLGPVFLPALEPWIGMTNMKTGSQGYVCLLEPSCWKRKVGVFRKILCHARALRWQKTKTHLYFFAFCRICSWRHVAWDATKIWVWNEIWSYGREQRGTKKTPWPHTLTCPFFLSKIFDGWLARCFSLTKHLCEGVSRWLAWESVIWNHCKNRHFGLKRNYKQWPKTDHWNRLTSGLLHVMEWTAFGEEKNRKTGVTH